MVLPIVRGSNRAGIPGVAGGLGVPAKTINFWKRAVFFSRVSAEEEKDWVFFSPFGGVFVLLGGVFAFFGVFLCFLGVFFSFARQREFLGVVNFFRGTTPKRGIPALTIIKKKEGKAVVRWWNESEKARKI